MFQSLVEERVRERQLIAFDRTLPTQEERERDASRLLESVSEHLRREEDEMRHAVEQPGALDPEREFGGLGSRTDLLRHVSGRLAGDLAFVPIASLFPPVPLSLPVTSSSRPHMRTSGRRAADSPSVR
jgi:hypothetical protein